MEDELLSRKLDMLLHHLLICVLRLLFLFYPDSLLLYLIHFRKNHWLRKYQQILLTISMTVMCYPLGLYVLRIPCHWIVIGVLKNL